MNVRGKRIICLAASLAATAYPSAAGAAVVELGQFYSTPRPSCPEDPCVALSRTTAYQARLGDEQKLFRVPASGRIVAWSVTLGAPTPRQTRYFTRRLGGPAAARITVLQPVARERRSRARERRRRGSKASMRVTAQTPTVELSPYFGQTSQFPLATNLEVSRRQVVALTVPTWAPVLQLGIRRTSYWRATRRNVPPKRCGDTRRQTAQLVLGRRTRFLCRYPGARLTYSVTLVPYPPRNAE